MNTVFIFNKRLKKSERAPKNQNLLQEATRKTVS